MSRVSGNLHTHMPAYLLHLTDVDPITALEQMPTAVNLRTTVSYTHLDVYKRQGEYYINVTTIRGSNSLNETCTYSLGVDRCRFKVLGSKEM